MLKKLTKLSEDKLDKVKAGKLPFPLWPILECGLGCALRCDPDLPVEDSYWCNGEICVLIA